MTREQFRLGRRPLLVLLAAALASRGGGQVLAAGPGPDDAPTRRRAQAATAPGAPRLPDPVTLRRSDGSTYTVALDDYLKGVTAGEMPPSWPAEALKAQAIAARTYTAAYAATYGPIPEANQAYNPANRTSASDAAVDATRNQVMLYQGGMIYAYYSSTCGGETTTSPDAAGAYCQSVRCWREADGSGRTALDLSSEAAAAAFWGATPTQPAFCSPAPSYRWSFSATRAEKEVIVEQALTRADANPTPAYTRGQLGQLRDLVVANRYLSGKVSLLRIVGTGGSWSVGSELDVRWVLTSTAGTAARSATAVVAVSRDSAGNVITVAVRGGGFGHAIGLCQYGAKGMADRGYDATTILRHYYSNVDLTTLGGVPVPPATGPRLLVPLAPVRAGA